jgi:hypothetical protein
LQRRQLQVPQLPHHFLNPIRGRQASGSVLRGSGGGSCRVAHAAGSILLSLHCSGLVRIRPPHLWAPAVAAPATPSTGPAPAADAAAAAAAAPGTIAFERGRARSGSCAAEEPVAARSRSNASSWRSCNRRARTLLWYSEIAWSL